MSRFFFIFFFGLTFAVSAQVTPTISFMKTFELQGQQTCLIEADGNVQFLEWGNDFVRVEMSVSVTNFTIYVLQRLAEAKRYRLEARYEGSDLVIFAPALQRNAKINGIEVNEVINFKVYTPGSMGHLQIKGAPYETPSTAPNTINSTTNTL